MLRRYAPNSFAMGLLVSILLHAGAAVAVVLISGGISSSGRPDGIFMVSFESQASGDTPPGRPAFNWSRLFPPATLKRPLPPPVAVSEPRSLVHEPVGDHEITATSNSRGSLTINLSSLHRDISPAVGGDTGNGVSGGGAARLGRSIVWSPAPPYPEAARRVGFEGRVLLEILVAPSGEPQEVAVERTSGRTDCDDSARQTVLRHWRFNPISVPSPERQKLWVRFALR